MCTQVIWSLMKWVPCAILPKKTGSHLVLMQQNEAQIMGIIGM